MARKGASCINFGKVYRETKLWKTTRKWAEAMVDEEDSGNTDTVLLGTCQPANILQKAIDVCGPDTNADDIGISGVSSNCRIFEMINKSDQKACHMETSPSVGGRNTGGKKLAAGERGHPDQGEYMVE